MPVVYAFTVFDITDHENKRQPYKATIDGMRAAGGVEVQGAVEEVPESALDGDGFYRPKA